MAKRQPGDKFTRGEERDVTHILSRAKSKKQLRKFAKKHGKPSKQGFYGDPVDA